MCLGLRSFSWHAYILGQISRYIEKDKKWARISIWKLFMKKWFCLHPHLGTNNYLIVKICFALFTYNFLQNHIFLHDIDQHFYTKCALQKIFPEWALKMWTVMTYVLTRFYIFCFRKNASINCLSKKKILEYFFAPSTREKRFFNPMYPNLVDPAL